MNSWEGVLRLGHYQNTGIFAACYKCPGILIASSGQVLTFDISSDPHYFCTLVHWKGFHENQLAYKAV